MNFDWYRLFRPQFWMQNYKTNWKWDKQLNELLDRHTPSDVQSHYCKIGDAEVWIANYPYAYARPCGIDAVPSAKTRKRLRMLIEGQRQARIAQQEADKWAIVKEWK